MVSKRHARGLDRLNEVAACQEINQNLRHASHINTSKDWRRFEKMSSHTPVIFYFWSPSSTPCRALGPILDHHMAGVDAVTFVSFEVELQSDIRKLGPAGAGIPFVGVLYQGGWQPGYTINGGRGDDEVRIEVHPDQIPSTRFRELFGTFTIPQSTTEPKKQRGMAAKVLRTTAAVTTMGGSLAAEAAAKAAAKAARGELLRTPELLDNEFNQFESGGSFYMDLFEDPHAPAVAGAVVTFAVSLVVGDAGYEHLESLESDGGLDSAGSGAAEPEATAGVDPLDQLKKLSELHEAGILSDEEFEAKKADLLDKI